MGLVTIKNECLTVEISTKGAEIQSVLDTHGKEFMWEGKKDVWANHAPIMFPICGGLKDDKFEYGGKEYTLQKHGFARGSEFAIESATENEACFLLVSNDETLAQYPFKFEFRARYVLDGNKLNVFYETTNKGCDKMYFSVGAHEAYACPEGVDEYSVEFEKTETLNAHKLDGNYICEQTDTILESGKVLNLKKDYFEIDALVFTDVKSRMVVLSNKDNTRKVTLWFDGFDYFLIWQKCGAEYVCLEPWCGIPDAENASGKLEEKVAITPLDPNKTHIAKHTMMFE